MPFPSHRVTDGDIITVDPKAVSTLKKTNAASAEEGEEAAAADKSGMEFIPAPYSQPFLFVPDYLEVNYNTCSTCFLRSPISRPGKTEIPSPFPPQMHALAYEFYARNRK